MNLEKWGKLSFAEQIGNIGSEFSRAKHWEELSDFKNREKSLERVIELIDLTIEDSRERQRRSRIKELSRLREILCDKFLGFNIYSISAKNLQDYFLQFGLIARK